VPRSSSAGSPHWPGLPAPREHPGLAWRSLGSWRWVGAGGVTQPPCQSQPLAGGHPIPGHAAPTWPGHTVKGEFSGRSDPPPPTPGAVSYSRAWRAQDRGIQAPRESSGMASVFMCGVEDLLFSGSRFVWNLTVSTLRRWYTERLRACHQVLRTWCGLRDVYQVSPGAGALGPLRGCPALN
jgi:hypothetical protein